MLLIGRRHIGSSTYRRNTPLDRRDGRRRKWGRSAKPDLKRDCPDADTPAPRYAAGLGTTRPPQGDEVAVDRRRRARALVEGDAQHPPVAEHLGHGPARV